MSACGLGCRNNPCGHVLSRSLGQNFLTDDTILRNIVMAARVKAGDVVMEIGPGTGNLTKHLLQSGALVTAVEKDDTLYARLTEEYKEVLEGTLVSTLPLAFSSMQMQAQAQLGMCAGCIRCCRADVHALGTAGQG